MTTPNSEKQLDPSRVTATDSVAKTGTTRKKPGPWDKPVKALVLVLGLLLFGWLLWLSPLVRQIGVPWLGKLGTPAVPMLRHALQDDDHWVRAAAAEALRKVGPAAVSSLVEALTDASARVRAEAAFALGVLGVDAREVASSLVQALTDADARVRAEAAKALGIVDPEATDALPLLTALVKDADPTVRAEATEAMSIIGRKDASVLGLLLELIEDPHHRVRQEAAEGLGRTEVVDQRVRPVLAEAAKTDPDSGVRKEAGEALFELDNRDRARQENKGAR
jgi:HEAT repeat protein